MKKYKRLEKEKLLFDLDRYTNNFLLYASENNNIWRDIICNVKKYNDLMHHTPFLDNIPNCPLIQFERPDVIYYNNDFDYIMGIECFVFDASRKSSSKGSAQIRKELEVKEQLENDYRNANLIEGDGKSFSAVRRKVNIEFSAHYYWNSLIENYLNHSTKIQEYRNNLERKFPNKKAYMAFFIEDITALGNYVEEDGKIECMTPFRLPPFLKVLAETRGLDYVLIKTTDRYVPNIDIQSCDKRTIENMLKNSYSKNAEYISYQYSIEQHIYKS